MFTVVLSLDALLFFVYWHPLFTYTLLLEFYQTTTPDEMSD